MKKDSFRAFARGHIAVERLRGADGELRPNLAKARGIWRSCLTASPERDENATQAVMPASRFRKSALLLSTVRTARDIAVKLHFLPAP